MSAITAKASRKMKKYAVLTREPRCFLGSFDFSWEQRKFSDLYAPLVERNSDLLPYNKTLSVATMTYKTDGNGAADSSLANYKRLRTGDIAFEGHTSKSFRYGRFVLNDVGDGIMSPRFSALRPLAQMPTNFWKYYIHYEPIMRKILVASTKAGTMMNELVIDEFLKSSVLVPSIEEQTRIGSILKNIDNLITLHQRKCALLFSPFQALISMMFTTSTFSWEQRKFEEIAVRSSVICSDDTLPRVEYEDIVSGTGRLNKDIYAKQSIKSGIAFHQGDVLYGKLRPYLQNWLLPTFDGLAVGDFWVLQPQNADSSFLYRLIQSRQFDEVANQSTGTKMPRADWKLVSKTVFSIPSNISEQAAIGTYFTALDSLITLHQRKCISFTGRAGRLISTVNKKRITSSWEQRKFSDITFPAGEKNRDNLPLESYSITNEHGFVPQDEKFENGGTMREADKRMYYIVSPNSFAYNPARINVGSIGYQNIGKNVIVSSLYEVFKTSEDVDDRLLWHWFKSPDFQKLIMQLQEGGVRLYFYYDKLCMGEVSLPSLEEQRKIGKLFDTLDNLITLHQRKPFLMKWRNSDANRNQTNRLVL